MTLANAQNALSEHVEASGDTLKSLEERWLREELAARVDLLKVEMFKASVNPTFQHVFRQPTRTMKTSVSLPTVSSSSTATNGAHVSTQHFVVNWSSARYWVITVTRDSMQR